MLCSNLSALILLAEPEGGMSLPLKMLIIFGAAKLLGTIFERFGQPGIVGQILAGILVGPAVFDWIQPDRILGSLAELGVIFLLFRVGLEVKASELWRVGSTALLVALLGVLVPLVGGWLVMRLFGAPNLESMFVGVAMVATSVGITAEVLANKGWLEHKASKIILAAAVIDDVLGLLALALVTSFAEGGVNWISIGTTALVAIAFTVIVATLGARAAKHLVPRIEQRVRVGETQFNIALVVLFALSFLAEKAGVAAIIGAFLAGMTMAETVNHRVHDLAHGITEFLLPFFLAGIGLNLSLAPFADKSILLLTVIVVVVAVLTKMLGSGIAVTPMGAREMFRVGVGMVPRGEVGMVVAQLGLSLHVIEQRIYAVVVFMAIATTIIAPPLLTIAFRGAQPVKPPQEEFTLG